MGSEPREASGQHEWDRVEGSGRPGVDDATWICARCGGYKTVSPGTKPDPSDRAWVYGVEPGRGVYLGCEDAVAALVIES